MEKKLSQFMPRKNYVIYNLCLVMIPIILLTALFFGIMKKHVTDEMIRMYTVDLEQKKKNIDERMENFGSMMAYASVDKDLTPFQLKQNSYETITALQHMRQLASAQGDSLIFFYIQSDDCLYSPNGKWSKKTFEKEYVFEGGWGIADFFEMLNHPDYYAASPLNCSLHGAAPGSRSYLAVVFPWTNRSFTYGAGVCLIPKDWLANQLFTGEDHPVYCVDAQGDAFGQGAGDDFIRLAALTEEDEILLRGQKWHLIRCKSDVLNWRYITAISEQEITAMIQGEKPWLFPVVLLLALLCVFLGIMVAMRYYWPIEKLGKMLGAENEEVRRVHHYVSSMMNKNEEMATQNEDMRQSLEATQDTLAQEMLAKILWRDADEEICRQWQQRGGISLKGNHMQVLAIDAGTNAAPVLESILKYCNENQWPATEAPRPGYIAVVYAQDEEANTSDSESFARSLLDEVKTSSNASPRIGIGSPCGKLSELARSYVEAIAALRDREPGTVCRFEDTLQAQSQIMDKKIAIQTVHLAEAIRRADGEAAANACDELEKNLQEAYRQSDSVLFRFTINSILKDILPCFEHPSLDNLMWKVNLAMHASKPETFMQHVRMLCQQSIQSMAYQKSTQQNKQMEDILEYVNARFTDQNLTQAGVAEAFILTTAAFSRLFSESVGSLFVDYISQKRMNYGAELLIKTDLSVKEIVTQVGYIDVSSFSRKFSKYFGVSPVAYRKQMR